MSKITPNMADPGKPTSYEDIYIILAIGRCG